jgi:tetratricopeptide (TPR) repeat protein
MAQPMKNLLALSAATVLSVSAMAQNKAILLKEQGSLDKAKTEIDQNVNEAKLSGKAKTWMVRGQIYEAIALSPDAKMTALDTNAAITAYESYKKALEVEPNSKSTEEIKKSLSGQTTLYNALMVQGNKSYQAKRYAGAVSPWTLAGEVFPSDTAAPLYTGISALQLVSQLTDDAAKQKYNTIAKGQFEKYTANNGKDVTIWQQLAQMYENDKEIDKSLATYDRAMKAFPGNTTLGTARVALMQRSGRIDEAIASMKELFEKNPNDAQSAVNLGIMYDNKSQGLAEQAKKATEEVRKAGKLTKRLNDEKAVLETYNSEVVRLTGAIKKQPKNADLKRQLSDVQGRIAEQKTKIADLDQEVKAEAAKGVDAGTVASNAAKAGMEAEELRKLARSYYAKAIAADPANYEANFNIGVAYFNEAVEMKHEVDNMSMADYSKNGKEVEGRVCGKFKQAMPYFQKAKSVKADDPALLGAMEQAEGILKQFEEKKVACVEPAK